RTNARYPRDRGRTMPSRGYRAAPAATRRKVPTTLRADWAARSCFGKISLEHEPVDLGQARDIGDRYALISLVHGLTDHAELGDRAISMDEPRIRGAASGAELRRLVGDARNRVGQKIADLAR